MAEPVSVFHTDKDLNSDFQNPYKKLIATNNLKHLGVTLIKQGKDLYGTNFLSLKKEIEEGVRRWKELTCS